MYENQLITPPYSWRASAVGRLLATGLTILAGALSIAAQTITGEQKIIYSVIDPEAKTVQVSIDNRSMHRDDNSAITIPETVTYKGISYTVVGIAQGAFADTKISGLDIQAPIAEIPADAFSGCVGLSSVTMPETLTSIGENAFKGCSNLTAPSFPEALTTVGASAFEGCSSLGKLTLPVAAALGERAFAGADISCVIFPATAVTMGAGLFEGVTSLTSVSMPSWTVTVPANMFNGCPDLTAVDFSGVTAQNMSVGEGAFRGCEKLASVTFPAKISSIGPNAFRECTSLTGVSLPQMSTLGTGAFRQSGIRKMDKTDWPETAIRDLDPWIFAETPIESMVIPEWMTRVPNALCHNCVSLASVTIPEGVTIIAQWAFGHHPIHEDDPTPINNVLTNLVLPKTLKRLYNYAFENNVGLTDVTFHEGIELFQEGCFIGCRLKNIVIPSTVKELGYASFCGNGAETITLPETLSDGRESIQFGRMVFAGNKIEEFTFPSWLTDIPAAIFQECQDLNTVRLAPGTTKIRELAFQNCIRLKLEDGALPETVTYIGEEAFTRCGMALPYNEYFINVVKVGPDCVINDNAFKAARIGAVEFESCDYNIGKNIFNGVTSVKSIVFPDCMTEIPAGICMNWINLVNVKWPANLQSIGARAFRNCIRLDLDNGTEEGNVLDMTKAPFDKVTEWGDLAFSGSFLADGLEKRPDGNTITKVIWPESGEGITIGKGLFSGNGLLESVAIPGWMDKLPARLFADCKKLATVDWEPSDRRTIELGDSVFMGTAVPQISWPDVPAKVGDYAFANCSAARSITWPASVCELGKAAFRNSAITGEVTTPDYITELPEQLFESCAHVTSFNLPKVTAISTRTFRNCYSAKSYKFAGLTEVPDSAFMGNIVMTSLQAPGVFTRIGVSGFESCQKMTQYSGKTDGKTVLDARAFYGNNSLTVAYGIPTDLSADAVFAGCSKLSHLIFSYNAGSQFAVSADCFDNVPLTAVSELYASLAAGDIVEYTGADRADARGWLNVPRDIKYRLAEKGYDRLFNLNERFDPAPGMALSGDIHSEFNVGDRCNHYKTALRWEIVQSDLNISGPTVYHLYRDGNEIAKIEIGQPTRVESIHDGNINIDEPAYACDVKVTKADGSVVDLSEMYGTIDYEVSENTYREVYANQHSRLYYDLRTSHRMDLNEVLGIRSWFVYVDEFDSPDLSVPGVPDRYVYTLRMDGGTYHNLAVSTSGLGSQVNIVEDTKGAESPEPVTVHATMVVPSIDFNGYYTLDEVQADTDHSLPVSTPFDANGTLNVHYALGNPEHVNHRIIKENGTTVPVVQSITSYEIPSRENPDARIPWKTISIMGDGSKAEGDMLVEQSSGAQEGASFQIVTKTEGRGTFGSRIVTVPGLAHLELESNETVKAVFHDSHYGTDLHVLTADITLHPCDLDRIFYTDGNMPTADQHRIGVWRRLDIVLPDTDSDRMKTAGADGMELVHHFGTNPIVDSWACQECRDEQHYDGNWLFNDHCDVPAEYDGQRVKFNADYLVRLYVQPADDDSKWMIAEARTTRTGEDDVPTGLEHVGAGDAEDALFFNLQGLQVVNPAHGQVLIMVDRNGSRKVRF